MACGMLYLPLFGFIHFSLAILLWLLLGIIISTILPKFVNKEKINIFRISLGIIIVLLIIYSFLFGRACVD